MRRWSAFGGPAAIALLVASAYADVLGAFWVSDDFVSLQAQSIATSWKDLVGVPDHAVFLRPLWAVSLYVDRAAFGLSPSGFRLHSVALHATTALLLAGLLSRGTRRPEAGLWAGLIFAASPLHPEAVTWISARNYPQAALAGVLAAWAGLAYLRGSNLALAGAALAYGLGLCAGEATIPLAFSLPLAVLAFGEAPRRRWWSLLGVLVAVLVVYGVVRLRLLQGLGGYRAPDGSSLHLQFAPAAVLAYVGKAVLHILAPGPWDGGDGPWVSVAVGVAAAANATLILAAPWDRRAVRAMLLLGLATVGAMSIAATWGRLTAELIGTRLVYLPHAFACGGLGALAAAAWQRGGWRRRVAAAAMAALLAAQVALTRTVNGWWEEGGDEVRAAIDGVGARMAATGARTFFLRGVWHKHRGAETAGRGLEGGIWLFLGPQLAVQRVRDEPLWREVVAGYRKSGDVMNLVAVGKWDAEQRAWRWQ